MHNFNYRIIQVQTFSFLGLLFVSDLLSWFIVCSFIEFLGSEHDQMSKFTEVKCASIAWLPYATHDKKLCLVET